MTVERIKGNVTFLCDLPGCDTGLETTTQEFSEARDEAKEAGWVTRNRDGVWKHFCCHNHEGMELRGQEMVR